MIFKPNSGKSLEIKVNGKVYIRIPIQTHVIHPEENLLQIIFDYTNPIVKDNDILIITEKVVAISQNRAIPVTEIKPRLMAKILSRFVVKTPYGIGLGIPETMEMAIEECGVCRILLASVVSALGKLIGRSGDFYRIAGNKARAIDGPTGSTLPPYNNYVVLSPSEPNQVAQNIKKMFTQNIHVLVVDINDLGGNILGSDCSGLDNDCLVKILADNPLGQTNEQTPIGIVRLAS